MVRQLAAKPHRLAPPIDATGCGSATAKIVDGARAIHHMLDYVDVPPGHGPGRDDAATRVLIAVTGITHLRERLERIASWHSRETGPVGRVGDRCDECGEPWPCDTWLMANGIFEDSGDDLGDDE
jgi:hypothetical protein